MGSGRAILHGHKRSSLHKEMNVHAGPNASGDISNLLNEKVRPSYPAQHSVQHELKRPVMTYRAIQTVIITTSVCITKYFNLQTKAAPLPIVRDKNTMLGRRGIAKRNSCVQFRNNHYTITQHLLRLLFYYFFRLINEFSSSFHEVHSFFYDRPAIIEKCVSLYTFLILV